MLVDRKLEEKRLKCKEATDATERIKKENNKLKIEVYVNCYTQNYGPHFLFLSFLFCNEMFCHHLIIVNASCNGAEEK